MYKALGSIALAILLAACAEGGGLQNFGAPSATVDVANDPNASRLQQDEYECRQLADQNVSTLKKGAIGAGVGGLGGAAGGAAIGAMAGSAGKGAAIGAGVGVLGGAIQQTYSAQTEKERIYKNCLRQRGHPVTN
jgi:outer membrane lipoprotein SlyB